MKNIYYLIVVFTAFLSSVSQVLLNLSNQKKRGGIISEYVNPLVLLSYAILAFVLVLNTYVLKFIPMMDAHVIAASTYIFLLILSRIFLGERITLRKIIGNIMIIAGILVFTS